MKKIVLLYALITSVLSSLNVGTLASQNLFSPISKSSYDNSRKFIRKYYDKKADINVLIPCFVLVKGYPTIVTLKDGTIYVNLDNRKYEMGCSYGLYKSLVQLGRHAVMTASFTNYIELPDAQDDFLFYKDKGVTHLSGNGTSRKTLDLFIRLAEAVRAQDKPLLEKQKTVSDSLCRVFKTYYPQEAIIISPSIGIPADHSYSELTISACVPEGPYISLSLKCEYAAMADYKETKPYLNKYGSILREVVYSLLVSPDLAGYKDRCYFTVDESVSAPKLTKTGIGWYRISLRESDLTPQTLLSLIKK